MQLNKMMKNHGFTLIELLVVISIIAILATVLLPALMGVQCSAREGTALAEISNMTTVLEVYKEDTGNYPLSDSATFSSKSLVDELKGDSGKKEYMVFKPRQLTPAGEWKSPVGYPYFYRNNFNENYSTKNPPPADVHNKDTFDVWTADCKTPEGSAAKQVAAKTKVKNW